MGRSLLGYLELKLHSDLAEGRKRPGQIVVRGSYDRSIGLSANEKRGKLFNSKRPTLTWTDNTAIVNCFPGFDYLFHFASVLSTYYAMTGKPVPVLVEWPDETNCIDALRASMGSEFPVGRHFVVGKVDMFPGMGLQSGWRTTGEFLWRPLNETGDQILLGCQHTLWGDIAGRLVRLLAEKNAVEVIYVGKLGSLASDDVPNAALASGDRSFLSDGRVVIWDNVFSDLIASGTIFGAHKTVRSVLEESSLWVAEAGRVARFVDPEIGPMADAAQQSRVGFSYLHIVSDSAATRRYRYDLSNERIADVIARRMALYARVFTAVLAHLQQAR